MPTQTYSVNSLDLIRLTGGDSILWVAGSQVLFRLITNVDNLAPRLVSYGLVAMGFDDASEPREFPFLVFRSQTVWDGGVVALETVPVDIEGYPVLAFQPNSNASGQLWTLTVEAV